MTRVTLRFHFLSLPAVVAAAALLAAPAAAQQDFSAVEVTAQHVAGPVHMLTGAGGNIGVSAGEDGIPIIDDQFEPLADKIRAAIAAISAGDLEFVVNTHFHGDHTGGNIVFGEEALIVAHTNLRKRLAEGAGARGKSVEEIQAAGLSDEWEGWGSGFINESVFIGFIFESL